MNENEQPVTGRWRTYAVLGAGIFVVACGYLVWTVVLDDPNEHDPTGDGLVEQAGATLTARAPAPTATSPAVATRAHTPTVVTASTVCATDPFSDDLPNSLPLFDLEHADWYGSRDTGLWASPADFGLFMPEGFAEAPGLWFAGQPTPVMWFGSSAPVELTGQQLGGDLTLDPVEPRDIANDIQWTDVVIPEPGCWELTGTSESQSLTMTVEVLPIDFRPDFQILVQLNDARPYDPPPTCPVSPLSGLEVRDVAIGPHYWYESGGLIADFAGWYVAGEQQSIGVYGVDVADGLTFTAHSLEASDELDVEATTALLGSDARVARFIFPSPGCWELQLETSTESATFTVFVYPAECLPALGIGEFIVSCEAP